MKELFVVVGGQGVPWPACLPGDRGEGNAGPAPPPARSRAVPTGPAGMAGLVPRRASGVKATAALEGLAAIREP